MILGRVFEGNYQAQRGDYQIIFYISEGMVKDGYFSFQTQLPRLKSKPLQEKKWFVFMQFFQHFLNTFFLTRLSWFSFRLNSNFQVHDTTINFSFLLFFFYSHDWSASGNDACHRWPSKLKHLFLVWGLFWKVGLLVQGCLYHFCQQKGLWLTSVFEEWAIFNQRASRH